VTPSGSASLAGTKAADLRTRLDLLFGEQVLIVAKETSAAAFDTDEYPGYVALLAGNAGDLQTVMRLAFGNTSAGDFMRSWSQQDRDLVEYAVGLVTHKQSQADASVADLNNAFVPQFSRLINSLTQMPAVEITRLVAQQLAATEGVIGDVVGQSFAKGYSDLDDAYALTSRIADPLAARIAELFPDKFPGDTSLPAVTTRVSLNTLLQEHAYLTTMATDALMRGRSSEAPAADAALAHNLAALGPPLAELLGASTGKQALQLWSTRDASLLGYATIGNAITRKSVAASFVPQFAAVSAIPQTPLSDELEAALTAIDEQRAQAFSTLAVDDRASATEMAAIADALAERGSAQG